ncbi:hypothetical protein HCH_05717 [Hahella chejuensis KCTC 2396]|uniref:Nudix hydrolase domain-containing protein n=1 Tax=Hahella chejuensis (strain KCTC 2396) TaxID=349521 RepID=Q2SAF3_HAHCH|nr:hypothetical protein HCH_05717 [Hahella chejuensis KCTC 2396]
MILENHVSSDIAEAHLLVLERILRISRLISEDQLENGRWQFVSFPASLFARSLLISLSDPDQYYFEKAFWQGHEQHSPYTEKQRTLLRTLELQRCRHHFTGKAQPTRFVHVAWGIIHIAGKILLRAREDKKRSGLKNYVLIGGRMTQEDLRQASIPNPLEALQSPFAADYPEAFKFALKREIYEETGLTADEHYDFKLLRSVAPYREVEGAGANHSFTNYQIKIFQLQLTTEGFFKLIESLSHYQELVWFEQQELINAKTTDGKMAYIDALVSDFSCISDWQEFIGSIPVSYQEETWGDDEIGSLTLPAVYGESLLSGRPGKERTQSISLTGREIEILVFLASLSKNFKTTSDQAAIKVASIGGGWAQICTPSLSQEFGNLANKLSGSTFPIIEAHDECYFRLKINPSLLFISPSLFVLRVDSTKSTLSLERKEFIGSFFRVPSESVELNAGVTFKRAVFTMAKQGEVDTSFIESVQRIARRDINPTCQTLGLRGLVRLESNLLKLAVDTRIFP